MLLHKDNCRETTTYLRNHQPVSRSGLRVDDDDDDADADRHSNFIAALKVSILVLFLLREQQIKTDFATFTFIAASTIVVSVPMIS